MEKRGQVNCYVKYKGRPGIDPVFFTINLAAGVTPFMAIINGIECNSTMYRFDPIRRLNITEAWYRPAVAEYNSMPKELQDHILSGGLVHKPIAVAITNSLMSDPVEDSWEHERFQAFVLETYGRKGGS